MLLGDALVAEENRSDLARGHIVGLRIDDAKGRSEAGARPRWQYRCRARSLQVPTQALGGDPACRPAVIEGHQKAERRGQIDVGRCDKRRPVANPDPAPVAVDDTIESIGPKRQLGTSAARGRRNCQRHGRRGAFREPADRGFSGTQLRIGYETEGSIVPVQWRVGGAQTRPSGTPDCA
jgi:hypothetical protein